MMYGLGGYGMGYGYGLDPTMILVLIGAAITMIASSRVNNTFKQYARVRSVTGMTGAEVAQKLLNSQGIYDVTVRPVAGELTDHYDPRTKTVNLSQVVYNQASVAALGVAAHECGHAIQDHVGYVPLKLRGSFVPVANIGSKLAWPMIVIGLILGGMNSFGIGYELMQLGIWAFSLAVLFQLITLPVEFNASHRAVTLLASTGLLQQSEVNETKKVLSAAALTYVAAAASSILQLLRLVILFGGRRNRD